MERKTWLAFISELKSNVTKMALVCSADISVKLPLGHGGNHLPMIWPGSEFSKLHSQHKSAIRS